MLLRPKGNMRLLYTTVDFVYKGRRCPDLPFLCDSEMEHVGVVNDYLLWVSLENSRTPSASTRKSYAEGLYDYMSWLEANSLRWDDLPSRSGHGEEISNIAMYRNWSLDIVDASSGRPRMQPSTVRKRLSQIMSFYRWAQSRERIDALPWDELISIGGRYRYSTSRYGKGGSIVGRDRLRPRVAKRPVSFLNIEQCRALLRSCRTRTLQMMTKLMLQSGLRNEECRTFPRKYLFDPSPTRQKQRVAIDLDPSDMRLKGNKPRRLYISWRLMKDLFDFANFGEGARRSKLYREAIGVASPYAFLNQHGAPWSEKGLCNAYRDLWTPDAQGRATLAFKVTPHMLRHTFATLELYVESQSSNVAQALAWVRDRLGHSSIHTTTVYVHCLDMLGERNINQFQQEIDLILASESDDAA